MYLSIQDPQHAAGIDQQVVPFNRVQFIKEAPENFKSGEENLEKWVHGDIKDDGKYDSRPPKEVDRPPKEVDQHDTKRRKIIDSEILLERQHLYLNKKYVVL